jgi:copper(I)-binding protein
VSAAGSPISARPARRRRRVLAALAVTAVVSVTGCAAGIQAETSRERPTIDGVGSALGTLTIRNAYVGGPVENGGSAPVLLSVFNDGPEQDRLVGISSPEAGTGTLPTDVTLPSGGQQLLYTPDRVARLTGTTVPMRPGEIVPVVLTFERAGQLRMSLPVVPVGPELLQSGSAATPSSAAAPSGSTSPSAAASASAVPATPQATPASPYSTISP